MLGNSGYRPNQSEGTCYLIALEHRCRNHPHSRYDTHMGDNARLPDLPELWLQTVEFRVRPMDAPGVSRESQVDLSLRRSEHGKPRAHANAQRHPPIGCLVHPDDDWCFAIPY